MADVYRVRSRIGNIEIEVESSSKRFIDRKLAALRAEIEGKATTTAAPKKAAKAAKKAGRKASKKKAAKKKTAKKAAATSAASAGASAASNGTMAPSQLVSAIKKDARWGQIKKNIIDKSSQLPRILLCYYFAGKAGQSLAASDVEAATAALGSRIAATNVAKVIRQRGKQYLVGDTGGAVNIHSIGKRGASAVDTLIAGDRI
ncbi:MAG: hypothetical protein KC503_11640 [Myxococcales bacterium]|nr:hypothetical protein [Myxococcales bacterium]